MEAPDEIDEMVDGIYIDDDDDENPEDEPEEKPKRKPRRSKAVDKAAEKRGEMTIEDLQASEASELLQKHLPPKPAQNIKTLGDMYARFQVGENPEMHVEVHRVFPKLFRGGMKASGLYDTFKEPILEEQIQAMYGGGVYRVVVKGPNPSSPNLPKHYDSMTVDLAGEPKEDRLPRALQGAAAPPNGSGDGGAGAVIPLVPDNPKVVERAMSMVENTAQQEREERRRVEDRSEAALKAQRNMLTPIVDAERKRADDVIRAEREAVTQREAILRESMDAERRRAEIDRERMERRMVEVESEAARRPSMAMEMKALADAGLLRNHSDDGGIAKDMLRQVLERHQGEIESLNAQHARFIESLRTAHQSEMSAVREAHTRAIAAEQEASRSREARVEERRDIERQERLRDQDRFREVQESRDQQWRDRIEQTERVINDSWTARHQALISNHENRVGLLQTEIDRLRLELNDAKAERKESSDPIEQIRRMGELRDVMKGALGSDAVPTPHSGGIGISGVGDEWKQTLVEGALERGPAIIEALVSRMGGGGVPGQPPPPQQQPKEGDRISTPQGEMVVVKHPQTGQLALTPAAAYDKHLAAIQGRSGGLLPSGRPRRKPAKPTMSVVPRFDTDLPKPKPPWEAGDQQATSTPQPAPPPKPHMPEHREVDPATVLKAPMDLSAQERQGLRFLAKMVHDSVMQGEDPEDFVQGLVAKVPAEMLKQQITRYTTEEIIRGIMQVEPQGAGGTPAGQQFMRAAVTHLREILSEA